MAIPDEKCINGDRAGEVRHTITEIQGVDEEQNKLLLQERAARIEAEAAYQRLYDLFMQAPALICFLRGPQHVYELANPVYLQTIGHRNPIGKPIREVLPELEGQGIFELLDGVYTSGKPFIGNEVKIALDRCNNGILEDVYFNFAYQPSRNSDGVIEGILVHAVDITEQVLVRHKVQESEARLRRLVDSNIIGIIFTDIHGAITEANDTFLRMVGYTREDLHSDRINWADMTPPEYVEIDEQAMQEMQRHGAVASPYEKEYIASDGRRIPVLVGGALVDIAKGECMAFVIDICAQKKMEEELRKAKEQLEAILHTAADGITAQDIDGTILYANDIAARVSGFSSAEAMLGASPDILKQTVNKFVMKDEEGNLLPTEELPGRRALQGEKNVQVIIQYVNKATGHIRWSLVKAEPIFNEDGRVQFAVNVITDISEQQELEQRKNEFIGMASHELKTPVTALKGFTNILQRRATKQEDEKGLHYLARMDSQLNKLTKLVSNLLDISKMQAGKLVLQEEAFDLAGLIHEIVENLQEISPTHQLQIEEMAEFPIIGDRDRIGQVLINLLTNAIKYSPRADKVIVGASTDGKQVIVSVQDFGIGIAENYHQQIFDRFYQVTDPEEKTYPGLGIGLYISCEIIKRHGGRIWVESVKGKGATFFFTLPL